MDHITHFTPQAIESYLPYLRKNKFDPSGFSLESYIRAVIGRRWVLKLCFNDIACAAIIADHPELEEDISDEDSEVSTKQYPSTIYHNPCPPRTPHQYHVSTCTYCRIQPKTWKLR
jgi:hypothetical protein